jgi:hypothetical protein
MGVLKIFSNRRADTVSNATSTPPFTTTADSGANQPRVIFEVNDIRFNGEPTLARVREPDKKAGSWMMRKEDLEGLSPAQIRDKFALPESPTLVSDVKVPAGTVVRMGEVAPRQAGDTMEVRSSNS